MFLLWNSLPYILFGAFLVALATWLTTTRGNTISDILSSEKFSDSEAIRLEIYDKVKLASTVPIVALYVIAGIVAVGPPVYFHWNTSKNISETVVTGTFTVPGVTDPEPILQRFCLQPEQTALKGNGHFSAPVLYIDEPHEINLVGMGSVGYLPITLQVRPKERIVKFSDNQSMKPIPFTLVGRTIELNGPVPLTPRIGKTTSPTSVENKPTQGSQATDPGVQGAGSSHP